MTGGPRAGAGAGRKDPATRTRRIVVLIALGVLCALVLAAPLRLYVEQQQQIAALRADIRTQEEDVAALEGQLELWRDEAFVAAQARDRLNFVFPGETAYVVPERAPEDPAVAGGEARPAAAPDGTWYDRLWSSVEAVGTGSLDPVMDAPVVGGEDG